MVLKEGALLHNRKDRCSFDSWGEAKPGLHKLPEAELEPGLSRVCRAVLLEAGAPVEGRAMRSAFFVLFRFIFFSSLGSER